MGLSLSTMKKDQLIEECKKMGLDSSGKVTELKERLKIAIKENEKGQSVEELFKNYESNIIKS